MNNITAIILVGGKGTRLQGLTKNKSKSYVSFLGKYRIIDYPLSSLSNSSIYDIGVLTQYEPYELMRYIGSGASWDADIPGEGISFLTPFEVNNEIAFQKGTANAVLSQIEYIKNSSCDYILILPGDQIYKMDFRKILEKHIQNNASLSIVTVDYSENKEDLSRFGIIEYDSDMRIQGFEEKPEHPKSNHVSTGIYLFSKDILLKYLKKATTLIDFGKDFIPFIVKERKDVFAYDFKGMFMDLGTIKSLFEANMYYIDHPEELSKRGDQFRVYSKPFDYPPHIIRKGASVKESVVADASNVSGKVFHSILSFYTVIEEGAEIDYSIILPHARISKNTKIKNAIVDEDLLVPEGLSLIFDKPTLVDHEFLKEVN